MNLSHEAAFDSWTQVESCIPLMKKAADHV
jgi:hypothetical protein